jgi:hypothetical protein
MNIVRIVSSAANIEATYSLLPQALISLFYVGIPNPLLQNPLKSLRNTRLTP